VNEDLDVYLLSKAVLDLLARREGADRFIAWHDAPERTTAEVVAMLNEGQRLLESDEAFATIADETPSAEVLRDAHSRATGGSFPRTSLSQDELPDEIHELRKQIARDEADERRERLGLPAPATEEEAQRLAEEWS
jgi:hypothetical protein